MESCVLSFGKHRGRTLNALLHGEPSDQYYAVWLYKQTFVKDKYPDLFLELENNKQEIKAIEYKNFLYDLGNELTSPNQ